MTNEIRDQVWAVAQLLADVLAHARVCQAMTAGMIKYGAVEDDLLLQVSELGQDLVELSQAADRAADRAQELWREVHSESE